MIKKNVLGKESLVGLERCSNETERQVVQVVQSSNFEFRSTGLGEVILEEYGVENCNRACLKQ